jgi:hypothetical protein
VNTTAKLIVTVTNDSSNGRQPVDRLLADRLILHRRAAPVCLERPIRHRRQCPQAGR